MAMDGVLRLLLCSMFFFSLVNAQVPAYLSSTFFGNAHRIAVPVIPNSISEPALNAPAFSPFQRSTFSQPQSPVGSPLAASFHNVGQATTLGIQQQPQFAQVSPTQVSSLRLGKAIETGSVSKPQSSSPVLASFNQFRSGPGVSQSSLQDSLGQALDQASKSSQFSLPPNASPGPEQGGANFGPPSFTRQGPGGFQQESQKSTFSSGSGFSQTPPGLTEGGGNFGPPSITRQGPGFPQRQQINVESEPRSPIPSTFNQVGIESSSVSKPQSSSPVLASFNQFRSGQEGSQSSLQDSLGQALDQASKSAPFSLPQNAFPGPEQGGANFGPPSFTRQGPGGFQQESQKSPFSSGSGFSQTPQLDLGQALTKASGASAGRPGPRTGTQLSNIGPVIPAVPSEGVRSRPLLEEINLGGQSPGSFRSSEPNIFRVNSGSQSSPLIRKQTVGSPSRAQSVSPLVFDATPTGNAFGRQPFRSDPKISEQRVPSNSKIFLGGSKLSGTPRSSSLTSGSVTHKKTCTKTFREECHNEYSMVCGETFTEREKYECKIVEETKCEKGHTTEYEPACFQQILENCENICKRGVQPDCMPQCARSLGKTSCHKVKVVTPHTTCIKVPKEVCGNVTKRVPYEKCHDVPKKVCEQVPREVCN